MASAKRWITVAAILILVTACSAGNNLVYDEAPIAGESDTGRANETPPDAPRLTAPALEPTPRPADSSTAVPTQENAPSPVATEPSTVESIPAQASDLAEAAGCTDPGKVRNWMANAGPEIAEAASGLPSSLWLCPASYVTSSALTCHPAETATLLEAIEQELGDTAPDPFASMRTSGSIFCEASDIISLGLDDLLNAAGSQDE